MAIKGCFILVFYLLFSLNSYCQVTIWEENFDSYPDGVVVGANLNNANPSADWVSGGCSACIDTADWWETRSGAMEARDVNQTVYIQTEVIDITSFTDIEFSIWITESGDHEGPYFGLDDCVDQANQDFVNVYYRINGETWNLISNFLDWCGLYGSCLSHTLYGDDGINSGDCRDHDGDWGSTVISKSGLNGNTLEIRLEAVNSSTTELIQFDNLIVKGKVLLPVTLKTFNVTARGRGVQLRWQTASESQNDYFQVERSNSGISGWKPLGIVFGAGNSNEILSYAYEDRRPIYKRSFYRLKQVDFDGKFTYSPIKSIIPAYATEPYPNPASNYLIIPLDQPANQEAVVRLFDISGSNLPVFLQESNSFLRLDLATLSSGNYFLQIKLYGKSETHRLVIVR